MFPCQCYLALFHSVVLEKKRDLARGIEIECENGERKSKAITSQESVMSDVETST